MEGAVVEVVDGVAQQPLAPVLQVDHTAHLPTGIRLVILIFKFLGWFQLFASF